ncbi:MAG: terminase small subunit [Clostridia bacterium]|nr:terminase small subunit [Clostridia bacterium]
MSKSNLTEKEMLFCRFYHATRNPREAAVKSGYKIFPEKVGLRLLSRQDITDALSELNKQTQMGDAAAGLRRLAFSSISDALRLIFAEEPLSPNDLEGLDLFMVSEIKRPKGGGMEIKFFDRIKALEKLSEIDNISDGNKISPFYSALTEGVKQLSKEQNDG